ncbi:MAG: glycosyltransferase [Acidobacteriota bacterium]
MTPRKILITNNTLDLRAGSEMYALDLARELRDRGFAPMAFSTVLGDVAAELRLLTVPVTDDLRSMTLPPDVIHGQHHLETMAALEHFPGVPAIYLCHGWLPWEEIPPIHPRIFRYVAVDETVRDRLLFEHGISAGKVEVILNFVDLDRFPQRQRPLPERAGRALVYSNDLANGPVIDMIRAACGQRGISLDLRGFSTGSALTDPEHFLGQYDIVFARGRSAIEALAAGAAVIPITTEKFGPMVTVENLDELRTMNFGIRAVKEAMSAAGILREIDRYDASDATAVTGRVRSVAGIDAAVDALGRLYEEAIVWDSGKVEVASERAAVAGYLQWIAGALKGRVIGMTYAPALRRRVDALANEVERLEAERRSLSDEVEALRSSVAPLENEKATLQALLAKAESENRDWQRSVRGRAITLVRKLFWR